MSQKKYYLPDIGDVIVFKRRGTRKINLRVSGNSIRITQPIWLPYANGFQFANANKSWILQQLSHRQPSLIYSHQPIGKTHKLLFQPGAKLSSSIKGDQLVISHPSDTLYNHPNIQNYAKNAITRVLKTQAEKLLTPRLDQMSDYFNLHYSAVKYRKMRSRWGSCNNKRTISINIYLLLLDWELIDYVLLHELTHTKHMNHGKDFWASMQSMMPDYKLRKKKLKKAQQEVAIFQV